MTSSPVPCQPGRSVTTKIDEADIAAAMSGVHKSKDGNRHGHQIITQGQGEVLPDQPLVVAATSRASIKPAASRSP